ncbi:ribonuclease P protein subunit p14-like isoform X2 [Thrips palmi]|uniref:Ribonuclease P protein subunit p14-like isoform X2 n=1 Tax=Thrips palmi TaxID=161013 RepID=A0A6P8ZW65_THRPL|nr:ribonuclease P protein subunit p14-like isoform X2 [Thrips palmi]
MSDFFYLDVSLNFDNKTDVQVDDICFKNYINSAIRDLHGDFGLGVNVDLLKYEEDKRRGIIRCPARDYVKIRGALTFCGKLDGKFCRFLVHQSSGLLLSLQANSRTFIHC